MLVDLPDVQTLSQIYQLPQPIRIEEVAQDLHLIHTPEGDFSLNIYHENAALDQQRYLHWLVMSLGQFDLSFAVPYPLRDHKGATIHSSTAGQSWVLAPRLSGQSIVSNDPDHAYATGLALADLHRALAHVQPLPRPGRVEYTIDARTLPNLRTVLPQTPTEVGLNDSPEGRHRLQRFSQLAERFWQSPPAPDQQIRWHIVHGDFFGDKLLYDGTLVTGVRDFSAAHPDYRAREVAEVLMRAANDLGPLFWGTARAFVEGYAEVSILTAAEIELVPRFIVESQVDRVLFYAGADVKMAADALRLQEDISAWLEGESERLQAMMRGVFLGE
jgi:homoserine kinase type II